MSTSLTGYIEFRPNSDGQQRAYVTGTRVRVQDIYALAELQGKTPDEIVRALPHLTLSQVHAALAYYFDHRQEIVKEMREDELAVIDARKQTGPGPLERRGQGADAGRDSLSS